MQNEVAGRAKLTQGVILLMTFVAFILGVILMVIAVGQVLVKGDFVFSAFSSVGGVATILGTLLYRPMKKSQKSMGDLAQVQIAYLSFNSKVTIWIEYVKVKVRAEGAGYEIPRIKEITNDIETAASKALEQIEKYCEPPQEKEKSAESIPLTKTSHSETSTE